MQPLSEKLSSTPPHGLPEMINALQVTMTWYGGRRFSHPKYRGTVSFEKLVNITKAAFTNGATQERFTGTTYERFNVMRCLWHRHNEPPIGSDWYIVRLFARILAYTFIPIYRFVTRAPHHTMHVASLMTPEMNQKRPINLNGLVDPNFSPLKKYLTFHGIPAASQQIEQIGGEPDLKEADVLFQQAEEAIRKCDPKKSAHASYWEEQIDWQKCSEVDRSKAKAWYSTLSSSDRESNDSLIQGIINGLKSAADKGHIKASLYLGNWYYNRSQVAQILIFPDSDAIVEKAKHNSIKRDGRREAYKYMLIAAKGGNVEAMKCLVKCYTAGFGYKFSPSDANYWQQRIDAICRQ